jgi:cytochrome P450
LIADVRSFRWPTWENKQLKEMFEALDVYVAINCTGGAALTDFYPILQWLPAWLMPFKRLAMDHHDYVTKIYTDMYTSVRSRIIRGDSKLRPCVSNDVVTLQSKENFSDAYAAYIPAQLWEAGSETTATQLYGFFQALLLFPHVQTKGQSELDLVVGPHRMPTLEDIPNLPYVRACVKEALRWHPVAILGAFPHATSEDDTYMGYRIPAGSIILLNIWTIHRDSARYPDPATFNPERYLGDEKTSAESATSVDVGKRDHFAFGGGRRICPGMNIADRSMLLGIAKIF